MELIHKTEPEVKYDTSLEDMKQALTALDKKLQTDLESIRVDYERQRTNIENIISQRGS